MAWCARRLSATIPRTTAIFRSGLSGDTGATSPPCGKQKPLWWPIWRWGVLWEPSSPRSAPHDSRAETETGSQNSGLLETREAPPTHTDESGEPETRGLQLPEAPRSQVSALDM